MRLAGFFESRTRVPFFIDPSAPPDAIYFINPDALVTSPSVLAEVDLALHPDPLIHSLRWHQRERAERNAVDHLWLSDRLDEMFDP